MEKRIQDDIRDRNRNSGNRNMPPVSSRTGQEKAARKTLPNAKCQAVGTAAPAPEYMNGLHRFLSCEYGFRVKNILPAKRGFYGETWDIETENGKRFLKIDYWSHHKKELQDNLPIIQYMTDSGISFIPKLIKTKDGNLYSSFRQGTAVVFEHIPGELSEDYSTAQLYSRLASIYQLKTDGITIASETFGAERLDVFQRLRGIPELPVAVKKALAEKEPVISVYAERLKECSAVCKGDKTDFHITHGDAGGNCILNGSQLFLVDWDSCLLAPIERDAWIFICDRKELETINSILAETGIGYTLQQDRLCYYCYDFFFHYLNEYLKSIADAESQSRKEEIVKDLIGYLTDCWIYERLETADALR